MMFVRRTSAANCTQRADLILLYHNALRSTVATLAKYFQYYFFENDKLDLVLRGFPHLKNGMLDPSLGPSRHIFTFS